MDQVRVRFAPSPTGELHLGGARTALINYIFAKYHNGSMVLRIEDTDVERSLREYEEAICEALHACGVVWDEGPDCGGAFAPYRQSERIPIYQEYVDALVAKGTAYRCFFTDTEIEQMRAEAEKIRRPFRLPKTYKQMPSVQLTEFLDSGKPYTIRLNIQLCQKSYVFQDLLKAGVCLPSSMVDDFVISRSNGYPPYNFAAVIDDHLMQITHVIRGEEHLSNTLRQLMLYEALGWQAPRFLHMPLIMGKDEEGRPTKLSKRHGDVSVREFLKKGILPSAFVNYLLTLGYTYSDGEIFSVSDVIRNFDLKRLSRGAAFWDVKKLYWYNSEYISRLNDGDFLAAAQPFLSPPFVPSDFHQRMSDFRDCILYFKGHIQTLDELPKKLSLFFDPSAPLAVEVSEALGGEESRVAFYNVLTALQSYLAKHPSITYDGMLEYVKSETGLKGKLLFQSLRMALTNALHGPELVKLVEIVPHSWFKSRVDTLLKQQELR